MAGVGSGGVLVVAPGGPSWWSVGEEVGVDVSMLEAGGGR